MLIPAVWRRDTIVMPYQHVATLADFVITVISYGSTF